MKVAMVTPRYPPNIIGGGEISCEQLVETLRQLNIDIEVLSGDVMFPKIKRKEKLFIAMYRYLKKKFQKYDVLHAYNMNLLPTLGLLTKKYNANTLGTLNGHVYSPTFARHIGKKPIIAYNFNAMMLKKYTRHIKRFTALSKFYSDVWVCDGLDENKISIIPNMIDIKYTVSKLLSNVVSTDNKVNLIAVGNYAKWRNFEGMIYDYGLLPKQNIELHIVGHGWHDAIAPLLKISNNRIIYYGGLKHNEIKNLFAISQIYLQPYNHFGIGRTLLEAAQNKCAIVATGDKENYLQLKNNIRNFTELEELVQNKTEQRRLARSNKMLVNKYFNPKRIAKQYIAIYEELLND